MKRIIVLVGPPGVGKSTIVSLAKKRRIHAVDIEDIHNEIKAKLSHLPKEKSRVVLVVEMKEKILQLLDGVPEGISIFGAGGYGGSFPQELVERVLLLPDKEVALARFVERDANDEEKKLQAQKFGEIYDYFLNRSKVGDNIYHRIINSNQSPEETLELILNGQSLD